MAIVVNKNTKDLYRYHGNNEYTNIRTGVRGTVDEEKAKDVFFISLSCIVLCEENPMIEKMINALNLKFFKSEKLSEK